MTALTPRLRMFAGPNGSGKSTLKDILPPQWLGVYVNADEIEKAIRTNANLNLTDMQSLRRQRNCNPSWKPLHC